jgi:hypothetical protein
MYLWWAGNVAGIRHRNAQEFSGKTYLKTANWKTKKVMEGTY